MRERRSPRRRRLFPQPPIRLGAEFQVNSYTPDAQTSAAVGIDATAAFVVAWTDFDQDGGPVTGIRAQRFNPAGVKLGVEFQVNSYTIGTQHEPAVGVRGTGEFVIVWQSSGQDGSMYGLFARRYSSSGTALAAEFQVNTLHPNSQMYAAVGVDGDGDFVVVWRSDAQDGSSGGIFGWRFDSAGAQQSVEFQINATTASGDLPRDRRVVRRPVRRRLVGRAGRTSTHSGSAPREHRSVGSSWSAADDRHAGLSGGGDRPGRRLCGCVAELGQDGSA